MLPFRLTFEPGAVARVQVHDPASPERRATAARFEVGDLDAEAVEPPLRHIEDTEARRTGKAFGDPQVLGAEEPEASTVRALLEDKIDVRVGPRVGVSMVARADDVVFPGAFDDGMVRVAVIRHEE
jgi:hypothetical protein